ncbi:MAG: hypothetical protein IKX33_10325 [Prevotella sp.]|nr:hypothetical protein [Prevotella sp.]
MKKITYSLLLMFFFLPLSISAQSEVTIIENGESQDETGTVITISEEEEYIDTDTKLYQVTGKNTFMLGDVIKDNIINVTDVTTLVGMVLDDAEYSKVADVNEDNIVNVTDVTSEVSVALDEGVGKILVESYEVEDITNVWIKNTTAAAVDQH